MADLSSVGFSDPDLEAMRTQLRKMNDQELRLGLGVLLFLAWGISYIVFHVAGVLIHLLLVLLLRQARRREQPSVWRLTLPPPSCEQTIVRPAVARSGW